MEKVLGSGVAGPEAMTSRESPITSEMIRVETAAGKAAAASLPAEARVRCLRTALTSPIAAPLLKSATEVCCRSSSVIPGGVSAVSAEPPPDIRQITRSRSPAPAAMSSSSRAAPAARPSGIGCAASRRSIRFRPSTP